MRMTAVVAAIALCTVIVTAHSAKADALSPVDFAFVQETPTLLEDIAQFNEQNKEETAIDSQVETAPVKHIVAKGETLSSIAKEYEISWQRLYDKNTDLEHPDLLDVSQVLIVPEETEQLEARELPQLVIPEPVQVSQATNSTVKTAPKPVSNGSSAGNGYARGYCTWYVKNRRPGLPNNLGNANTWASRAAAQGMATGSVPRVGAVAQATSGYMHVAIVDAVHADGTITVSEMNFRGWNVVSSRVASAANFVYIY